MTDSITIHCGAVMFAYNVATALWVIVLGKSVVGTSSQVKTMGGPGYHPV